ncbi:MAG: beta strand repeat-containing protein, partial [Isosphaeraceae bacterium]
MTTIPAGNKRAGLPRRERPRRQRPVAIAASLRFRPSFEVVEDRTLLATFLVATTADSGPGSLRQAILDSNGSTSGANVIDFAISGSGVQTIAPLSPLPTITASVLIDGTSQPGYTGTPLVELSGNEADGGDGFTITGSNVTIRGLDINGFSQGAGIHITSTGATDNWIYTDFLGTDPTGTFAEPNYAGVEIDGGATNNLIGTNGDGIDDASERNLLSGNLFDGVWITGQGTSGNVVAGNFLGTDITGTVALDNGTQPVTDSLGNVFGGGVAISAGASDNRIGTDGNSVDDLGERNVIAGSDNDAIDIWGSGTDGNVVAGNFIGTDVTGTRALDVAGDGVFLAEGASRNWIGVSPTGASAVTDEGNVVSGNGYDGVQLTNSADNNVIAGNKIGTDLSGTVAIGNTADGVEIDSGCVANTIGGTTSGSGNVISANGNSVGGYSSCGVLIYGTGATSNVVQGNMIGTDAAGTAGLGNVLAGVEIENGAASNVIGGTNAGAGNVISANGKYGVWITGNSTASNAVQGNWFGTDISGTLALGNSGSGVEIDSGADWNTIGGATAEAGNLITNNGQGLAPGAGVQVGSDSTDIVVGNQITANRIFGNLGLAIDLGGAGDEGVDPNSVFPRTGPNNLQNYPIIVNTGPGQFQGWLSGSLPNTAYRIDVFASAAFRPTGAGEAEDYLGSVEATTDGQGQITFAVPYAPPLGLPVLTATATDASGNTSDVSGARQASVQAPTHYVRSMSGAPVAFSSAAGNGIALEDPDAGPLDPLWNLELSVSSGTLILSTTAGLAGSGDGTGTLSYSGSLAAVDAALESMTYTPPAGAHFPSALTVQAQSEGATPLRTQVVISDGVFFVTNTGDSGAGSLRQAILDANSLAGRPVTVDFAVPGDGTQTIQLVSPLPAIAATVLIDGTSQPGFAGTPLIAIGGEFQGNSSPLVVSSGDVTIRGLALDSVAIDPTANEALIAVVHAPTQTPDLSLLGSGRAVLVRGSAVSPADPDNVIDEALAGGDYTLALATRENGTITLTITLAAASTPLEAISVGQTPACAVAGDFTGNGKLDLAVADYGSDQVSVLLGNG